MAELKLESKISKIYELQTRFEHDLKDHNTLVKQYKTLMDIVNHSKKQKDLPKDFLAAIKQYCNQSETTVKKIENRLGYIELLLELHKNNPEVVDNIVTLVFEILGIDNTEDPVIEENVDEKPE